ncbi:hypothetical protein P0136_04660 [Lentisphaerota bacterium ZTH]|nr:hypothetical protein JYG24_04220 [Lentisphaerota bacterium]WET07284.1 hypothetical protein P0136_04660 [Lentisphaerota bacterium ZTH]
MNGKKIARLTLFGALTALSFLLVGAAHKNEASVLKLQQTRQLTANLLEDSTSIINDTRSQWCNAVKESPLLFVKIETAATYTAD